MSDIKCTNCNQTVDSAENFCPHCGTSINRNTTETDNSCDKCGCKNQPEAAFCEQCGASLKSEKSTPEPKKENAGPKVLRSSGNYSGTMVKGKTSSSWGIFKYIILAIILICIIAFVVWYNTDPNAKETLGNIIFSGAVILIFGIVIWLKNRKKGRGRKRRSSGTNMSENDQHTLDDDDDDGDGGNDGDD